MKNQILEILSRDPMRNINIINFIEGYSLREGLISGNSVLIRAKSDRNWVMFSSNLKSEFNLLRSKLFAEDKCFAFLEDWMVPIICENQKVKWQLTTMQYYLPKDHTVPEKDHETASLSVNDAGFVVENSDYAEYLSVGYVADRIKRAPSSGIYINKKLAAWILTHDDLAIGSLHVLPDYRRQGFGASLTIDMINKMRMLGKLPFTYIEPVNMKSNNLVVKLGFVKHKLITWLELE
ncbi:MAG: GNAT family N-acetyltransferase [Melioribacteraceae bacterium]|nr:GNAT family N-acetyltransferase [Melioribacteraceae bacterium]